MALYRALPLLWVISLGRGKRVVSPIWPFKRVVSPIWPFGLSMDAGSTDGKCSAKYSDKSFPLVSVNNKLSSCDAAWKVGRCAVVWPNEPTECAPNCLHVSNQNEEMCEMDQGFCLWDAHTRSCSFNPAYASARRAFCDKAGGKIDRRLVDRDGVEPYFYAHKAVHEEIATPSYNIYNYTWRGDPIYEHEVQFCRGMFGDDDDKMVAHGQEPVSEVLSGMMRCWRPSPLNRNAYSDHNLIAEMMEELGKALPVPETPLRMYPKIMYNTILHGAASHYTVGLTNTQHSPTSHCHEFDYTSAEPDTLPGCHFFKASFQPLQKLVNCMVPLIRDDSFKELWHSVAEAVESRPTSIRDAKDHFEYPSGFWNGTNGGIMRSVSLWQMLAAWKQCISKNACSRWLSDYERALEIIKQVERDSWEGLDVSGIRDLLRRRMLSTLATPQKPPDIWPFKNGYLPALQETTVTDMIDKCFEIPQSGPSLAVAGADSKPLILKESTRCMPLMWDYVAIPGLPLTALWPRMWPSTDYEVFPDRHPLCARMALAGLVRQFSRTRYPFNHKLLRLYPLGNETCLTLMSAQCVNFKDCWRSFFNHHLQHIHESCAAIDEGFHL